MPRFRAGVSRSRVVSVVNYVAPVGMHRLGDNGRGQLLREIVMLSTLRLNQLSLSIAIAASSFCAAPAPALTLAISIGQGATRIVLENSSSIPSSRPSADDLLEDCLEEFADAVEDAETKIDKQVERAEFFLERDAKRGASDAKLDSIAAKFRKSASSAGQSGEAQINRINGRCMIRLRTAPGYERSHQNELFFRRDVAKEDIARAVEDAIDRIDEALADAKSR